MVYDFRIGGEKVRLWQRTGESYEHVLMKALGYAMFAPEFPGLEIETRVGLRYKPDLVARGADGEFLFWGEAGENSLRKTNWLLKHARVRRLVLFKIGINETQFLKQTRATVPEKYRLGGRLRLVNFVSEIADLTAARQIEKVSADWFTEVEI